MRKDYLIAYATIMVYTGVGIVALALQLLFIDVVSDFFIAILPSIYWTAVLVFSPLWGIIADSTGAKKEILIFNVIISSIIIFFHAIFPYYTTIVIFRFLLGFFLSSFLPVSLSVLLEEVSREEMGKRTSIFTSSRAFGFLVSGYVASFILYFFDVKHLFMFAALFFVSAISFILMLKDTKEKSARKSVREHIGILKIPGRDFIGKNRGYFLVIALSLRHISLMGLFSLIYVYMWRKGIPDYLIGSISSFNTITQVALMYPFGALSDRIGRKPMYMLGFILSIFVPISFIYASDPLTFSLAFILVGFSFSTLIAGAAPFLKEIAPKGREAEALSFLDISRSIGSIVGPIIVGILVTFGSYELMFEVLALLTMIATAFAYLTRDTKEK